VAQIARSAARALRLNEDLVETIALAHDLGHTPFGHAGQDALHDRFAAQGGFAAACWMRSVALVHLPTTLLAQGCTAVSGKSAIQLL
jgi:hypothetical protein